MEYLGALAQGIAHNWPIWLVTVTLIVAAIIDGIQLKVPNWITYPLIVTGWIASAALAPQNGMSWYEGLGWSLLGTATGLLLLLPAYAIGGMGAGDVKLLAGVGAWIHVVHTLHAFVVSALVGAVLAILMVLVRRQWAKHRDQFWGIFFEIITIRDPEQLASIAAGRKASMLLLPYGIPIAIGTIGYFVVMGMLV